ncbi:hypothetical protein BKA66DRAFT_448560 [Pyrenochaeta sp. MPI-SDFR-AT-0127]|nr:hypothetical protein BKA66DRAFT_448560 [Pyrenochaeta sp. MPI-SDFR-AT-0127]
MAIILTWKGPGIFGIHQEVQWKLLYFILLLKVAKQFHNCGVNFRATALRGRIGHLLDESPGFGCHNSPALWGQWKQHYLQLSSALYGLYSYHNNLLNVQDRIEHVKFAFSSVDQYYAFLDQSPLLSFDGTKLAGSWMTRPNGVNMNRSAVDSQSCL